MSREAREWLAIGATAIIVFGGLGLLSGSGAGTAGLVLNYLIGILFIVAIYALLALALQLQFGFAGLINLGLVAFAGLAAYPMGILWRRVGDEWAGSMTASPELRIAVPLLVGVGGSLLALLPATLAVQRLFSRSPVRTRAIASTGLVAAFGAVMALSFYPLDLERGRTFVILVGIVLGVVLAAGFALLMAVPAVRLREDYLAIVTLGAAEVLEAVYRNETWLTGGTEGLFGFYTPVASWANDTDWWRELALGLDVLPVGLAHAVLAVVIVAYVYVVFEVLVRSPWGRVLKAIREDDAVAAALGKDVTRYKLQALVIGSAAAALAGVLIAWRNSSLFPGHFARQITFFALIVMVVGGVSNNRGAIAGALILWGITELAGFLSFLEAVGFKDLTGPGQGIFIGLMLVLVMMFRPQGLLGRKEELLFGK